MSNKLKKAPELVNAALRAVEDAGARQHEHVTLEHLLLSLIQEPDVVECLTSLEIDKTKIEEDMTTFLEGNFLPTVPNGNPHPTAQFDEVITRAIGTALFSQREKPMPIDVLIHLLQQPPEDSHALASANKAGLTSYSIKRFLSHGKDGYDNGMDSNGEMGPQAPREFTSKEDAEKFIEKYCINLNKSAIEGNIDPLIGREEEVDLIIQITARRTKNNTILVGESGVGKTQLIEGLATKIVAGEVPEVLKPAVIYSLDVGGLMAGTRFRGDLEERMKQVLTALELIPDAILFIDEIHTIMGTGSGQQGSLDIANLLKPALSKGSLRCIGSTTYDEYRKHFEKDRALIRRFKKVEVKEPDMEMAKKILFGLKSRYEAFHQVEYTDAAINSAVDLTTRYIFNALLPDKAIDILDNAGARQRILPEDQRLKVIDVAQIEFEVSKVAKIPEQNVKEDETDKLQNLESDLASAVYGQETALSTLANAVFVARSGLRDTNKPSGCFLFAGPTGSGKTELAKQLAKTLGIPILRYDMSEYMEKHTVAKLIGAPPGYVGYGDGATGSGKLINDVEQHPYSVLLLDEIEKAHPDIYNIFLQVMDDGKLTSSAGKSVDFRNVILIMTTNAGAAEAAKNGIGFGASTGGDPTAVINRTFTPEFRNRLDAIVSFNKLKPEHVTRVVTKFIATLTSQALDRNVKLTVSDEAVDWLAKNGFDDALGARPLARSIHTHIKTPLSRLMVIGDLRNGGHAHVEVINDKLEISTRKE